MKKKVVKALSIVEYDNPPIVRGKHKFLYEEFNNKKMHSLRGKYKLDKVIASGKTEFKKMLLLRDWVSSRFNHGYCKRYKGETALDVLKRAEKGECFTCATFASVLVSCLTSLGFVARNLTIAQDETDFIGNNTNIGHCVAEVWSNQFRKWIVLDADTKAHFEKDEMPLSAYEVRKYWLEGKWKEVDFIQAKNPPKVVTMGSDFKEEQLEKNIKNFMKHNTMNYYHHIMVNMGNNRFSKKKYPITLNWVDEYCCPQIVRQNVAVDPSKRKHTDNIKDIYYTLNQAHISLSCHRASKGIPVPVLEVNIETETPWFDYFMVCIDKDNWRKRPERFTWRLKEGKNTIEAKPVNKFCREGVISKISVILREGDDE
ncbi:MAG: transglutaminase-like domain-containing protein [bacterium]|nr:transglutaminase-like domain-containing protein [bacterium]